MGHLNGKRAIELVRRSMGIPGEICEAGRIAAEVQQIVVDAGVRKSSMAFDAAHRRMPAPGEVGNLIHTNSETLDIPDFLAACQIARSIQRNAC